MQCTRYKQMIDLAVGNDLSASEWQKLDEHLSRCESCTLEMQIARRLYEKILAARAIEIKPPNPVNTIEVVLGQIEGDHLTGHIKFWEWLRHCFTRLWPIQMRPSVAISSLTIATLLVFLVVSAVNRLTEKVEFMGTHIASLTELTSNLSESLRQQEEQYLRNLLETNLTTNELSQLKAIYQPFSKNSDKVIIDAQTLDSLVKALLESQRLNRLLVMKILRDNPELRSIDFKDGLDGSEIKTLIKNRSELTKLLDQL